MLVLKIDKIITEISINYSEFRSWKVTMSRITNDPSSIILVHVKQNQIIYSFNAILKLNIKSVFE